MGLLSIQSRRYLEQIPPAKRALHIHNTAANGTHTITVYQTYVEVINDGTYTETLTLPSVVEATGLMFLIRVPDDGNGCTVQDADDSIDWTDVTSNDDNAELVLLSVGGKWHVLESGAFA